ncbi:hypothetical protein JCM10450v2_001321 [Rhodotorula kratochvilovae]
MCFSSSTLFYGLTVHVISLCLVARAYPRIKPALLALDLVRARREAGTLETRTGEGDADVSRVPGEVWQVVKKHVVEQCYADEVHDFIAAVDMLECRCDGCVEESDRMRKIRQGKHTYLSFHLDDLYACEDRALANVLADFALCVPNHEVISEAEFPSFDLPAYPVMDAEVPHELGPAHFLSRISPAVFALPPDVDRRFHRLLATFPMLEPTSQASDTICLSSEYTDVPARRPDGGPESEEAKKASREEERRRARDPGVALRSVRSLDDELSDRDRESDEGELRMKATGSPVCARSIRALLPSPHTAPLSPLETLLDTLAPFYKTFTKPHKRPHTLAPPLHLARLFITSTLFPSAMCGSNAQLFFGLYVEATSLVVGARAWSNIKPTLLAIDLICARRRSETLETTAAGTGVKSLPEEVWDIVKGFVGPAAYVLAAHSLVMDYHDAHDSDDGEENDDRWGERLYELRHMYHCESCVQDFSDEGGSDSICRESKTLIVQMLENFGLHLVAAHLHTREDTSCYDFDASLAIALPLGTTKNPLLSPVARIQFHHPEDGLESHDVVRFPAEAFNLPADTSSRFNRLFAAFPLEAVDPSSQIAALPSQTQAQPAVQDKEPEAQGTAHSRSRLKAARERIERARTPSWLLWSYSGTC